MATSDEPLLETRFLTIGEIARIARVSKMTVYREVHAGRLESVRRWLGGALNPAA